MSTSINKNFTPFSLLKFAMPSIIMMILMSLYTITDGIFISRYIGSNALSSLNIVFPVINIAIAISTMLGTGGNAIISKYLGEGKKEAAIALQKLASINGWTVREENGVNKLFKPDGSAVTDEELKEGAKNLINYYYVQQWDGKLPETYFGTEEFAKLLAALGKASGTGSGETTSPSEGNP